MGDGLVKSADEGVYYLRCAATDGAFSAMEKLGDYLLDECGDQEGHLWLQKAADGLLSAKVGLALRLLSTPGAQRDGVSLLSDAAEQHCDLAMLIVGVRELTGDGIVENPLDGAAYLSQVGVVKPADFGTSGLETYLVSLDRLTVQSRSLFRDEAAALLTEGWRRGDDNSTLNLAYVMRRGHTRYNGVPSIVELLDAGIRARDPVALVNQCLLLASASEDEAWRSADRMFRDIPADTGIVQWWHSRADEGDPEGHLVIGWLCRHRAIRDPDCRGLADRLSFARAGGWHVPQWMEITAS